MRTLIYWQHFAKSSYNHGGSFYFQDGKVFFSNPLMPPSFAMNEWVSQTNFQDNRVEPDLPLLKRGHTYQIDLEADIVPQKTVYIRIDYYNRLNDQIGFEILKNDKRDFCYPKDAYWYKISLINAGCESMVFKHMVIYDDEVTFEGDSAREELSVTMQHKCESQAYHLVFLEEKGDQIPENVLSQLPNLIVISDYKQHDFFLSKDIEKLVWELSQLKELNLIGVGPFGNFAVTYYRYRYHNIKAFVTSSFYSPREYLNLLTPVVANKTSKLKDVWQYKQTNKALTYYGDNLDDKQLTIVSRFLKSTEQLNYLPFLK